MATKREDIETIVSRTLEGQTAEPAAPSPATPERFAPPTKRQVQIRFDPGDYETLQRIAYQKGTKASALIRQAVKEIIRTEGGA